MEFIQVKGNTWCLKAAELIPVYRLDARRCILLDSGWNWERENLKDVLEQKGLIPVAVIGSHAHEDHIGNHSWLRETYGAELWMSTGEAAVAESMAMRKLMYSRLSPVTIEEFSEGTLFRADKIIGPEEEEIEVAGARFRSHHTPGQSPDHICIGTPDGVCYVGDLVMAGAVRKNALLPFHSLHRMARTSMEKMLEVPGYNHYIIAHQKIVESLNSAVEKNLALLDEISECILELVEEPVTWDTLMTQVLDRNQLYTGNEIKLSVYEWAVQGFVDNLRDTGKMQVEVKQGIRRYQKV